jgi:hypothetical protein
MDATAIEAAAAAIEATATVKATAATAPGICHAG